MQCADAFCWREKDLLTSESVTNLTQNLSHQYYRSGDVEKLWGYSGINERLREAEKAKKRSTF